MLHGSFCFQFRLGRKSNIVGRRTRLLLIELTSVDPDLNKNSENFLKAILLTAENRTSSSLLISTYITFSVSKTHFRGSCSKCTEHGIHQALQNQKLLRVRTTNGRF